MAADSTTKPFILQKEANQFAKNKIKKYLTAIYVRDRNRDKVYPNKVECQFFP